MTKPSIHPNTLRAVVREIVAGKFLYKICRDRCLDYHGTRRTLISKSLPTRSKGRRSHIDTETITGISAAMVGGLSLVKACQKFGIFCDRNTVAFVLQDRGMPTRSQRDTIVISDETLQTICVTMENGLSLGSVCKSLNLPASTVRDRLNAKGLPTKPSSGGKQMRIQASKDQWADPVKRQKILASRKTPMAKANHSQAMKDTWADLEVRARRVAGQKAACARRKADGASITCR